VIIRTEKPCWRFHVQIKESAAAETAWPVTVAYKKAILGQNVLGGCSLGFEKY